MDTFIILKNDNRTNVDNNSMKNMSDQLHNVNYISYEISENNFVHNEITFLSSYGMYIGLTNYN